MDDVPRPVDGVGARRAVLGLLVGLALLALDVVGNPFWCVSIGILVAAVAMPVRQAVSRER